MKLLGHRYKLQSKRNNRNEMCEFWLCLIVFDKHLFILLSLFLSLLFLLMCVISLLRYPLIARIPIWVSVMFFFLRILYVTHRLTLTVNCVRCDEMIQRKSELLSSPCCLLFIVHVGKNIQRIKPLSTMIICIRFYTKLYTLYLYPVPFTVQYKYTLEVYWYRFGYVNKYFLI